ncbi:MAG: hypothetical protein KDD47_17935, partial [Acidobacteria bacterium]|nr:hypothetical protein [Acidobacteriota bacterium]
QLFRWSAAGTSAQEDPQATARLTAAQAERWSRFLDRERSPAEERAIWKGVAPRATDGKRTQENPGPR